MKQQTVDTAEHRHALTGFIWWSWYARSAELMQSPLIQTLVWMRVPGDIIFSVGGFSIAWFVLRLWVAPKRAADALPHEAEPASR